jgi:hypothetical protein
MENKNILNREVGYLHETYSVEVNGDMEPGSRSRSIKAIASEMKADLIVMGVHARKRSKFLGSTVLSTIRKTKIPVLIIPEEAKFTAIKNITLAVDFSEMLDSAALDPLFDMYKKFDSSMRVLHVEERAAELKAAEVPEKLQLGVVLSRFTYQYEKAESYDVEEGIQNFIDRHPTDLLVLVAHDHTIYERMFETIHTKSLTFKMKLPLLVVKHR